MTPGAGLLIDPAALHKGVPVEFRPNRVGAACAKPRDSEDNEVFRQGSAHGDLRAPLIQYAISIPAKSASLKLRAAACPFSA